MKVLIPVYVDDHFAIDFDPRALLVEIDLDLLKRRIATAVNMHKHDSGLAFLRYFAQGSWLKKTWLIRQDVSIQDAIINDRIVVLGGVLPEIKEGDTVRMDAVTMSISTAGGAVYWRGWIKHSTVMCETDALTLEDLQ